MTAAIETATYSRPRHDFLRRVQLGGDGVGLVGGTAPDALVRDRAVTCDPGHYALTEYGTALLKHWDDVHRWRHVTITHTWDGGTVLTGTKFGDGAWSRVVDAWEWRPIPEDYRLIHSQGKQLVEVLPVISRTVTALQLIGFRVDTNLTFEENGE